MDGVTPHAPPRTASSAPRTHSAVNIMYAITGGLRLDQPGDFFSSLTLSGLLNLLFAKTVNYKVEL